MADYSDQPQNMGAAKGGGHNEGSPYFERDMSERDVLMVLCPACGLEGKASECLSDWNGHTYLFSCCGARAHLDEHSGGAKTWLVSFEKAAA